APHETVSALLSAGRERGARAEVWFVSETARTAPLQAIPSPDSGARAGALGARTRLDWSDERVKRFIAVVDKLFTVDRLGWYRHVLAMRLLVPDEIRCGERIVDVEAMRFLHALRAAAAETLGRPLLAAFMPNFSVGSGWLESLEVPAAARALAGLRDALVARIDEPNEAFPDDPRTTTGIVARAAFLGAPAGSLDALLPVLIPSDSAHAALAERLSAYRAALIELFGATASSVEAVRLGAMTQPNHALDDRLWQLVGTVAEVFGGVAVA
ncbi:MAG: hypothetical protein ACREM2_07020, partial [Vulcanimicrobiaceae bacterium]